VTLDTYPQEELWAEISYLAYHFHWELETLLGMEHADRARFVEHVASLNQRAWEGLSRG
jgi:hypothetical protein